MVEPGDLPAVMPGLLVQIAKQAPFELGQS
jgi:hypothetical protein